jgi:transcription antitermination factor NusG
VGQLDVRGVEHFLPVYMSVRRWKDRRVTLQFPLFPGYVFVRLALRDRWRVQQLPGVARLVGFGGEPVALEDREVDGLREALSMGMKATPHPNLNVGRKVRVITGPLAGREGVLKRRNGSFRFVLSMDLIQRSILVDVDVASIEPLPPN